MTQEKVRTEEFRVDGEELLSKIKNLMKEGNIRRIIIKNKEGKVVFEIPLTFGVVGALIAPQLAAIGAIAALLTEATVVVEKSE
jgi:CBS domain-containing protein